MRAPDFETLLERYHESSRGLILRAPRSAISADDIAGFERREGITLPADYVRLLQRWDLTAIEINFTTFYPPFADMWGILEAIEWGRRAADAPFAELYNQWQALPVGEDVMRLQLIMSVQEPPATPGNDAKSEPPLTLRPYGSIWAFDAETRDLSVRFVSSTFTQTLHTALVLWSAHNALSSGAIELSEVRSAIATIDGATEHADYWSLWIKSMRR